MENYFCRYPRREKLGAIIRPEDPEPPRTLHSTLPTYNPNPNPNRTGNPRPSDYIFWRRLRRARVGGVLSSYSKMREGGLSQPEDKKGVQPIYDIHCTTVYRAFFYPSGNFQLIYPGGLRGFFLRPARCVTQERVSIHSLSTLIPSNFRPRNTRGNKVFEYV